MPLQNLVESMRSDEPQLDDKALLDVYQRYDDAAKDHKATENAVPTVNPLPRQRVSSPRRAVSSLRRSKVDSPELFYPIFMVFRNNL